MKFIKLLFFLLVSVNSNFFKIPFKPESPQQEQKLEEEFLPELEMNLYNNIINTFPNLNYEIQDIIEKKEEIQNEFEQLEQNIFYDNNKRFKYEEEEEENENKNENENEEEKEEKRIKIEYIN